MPRRQDSEYWKKREAGDPSWRDLQPPSERRLADSEKCGGRAVSTGKPCGNKKGSGTDHPGYGYCARHGGNTEAGVKAAMKEAGTDYIQSYKEQHLRFGGNRRDPSIANMTPEAALLEEVRRSAAMVRFLEERIAHWTLAGPTDELLRSLPKTFNGNKKDPSLRDDIVALLNEQPDDSPDSPHYLPALTSVHPKTGITSFTDAHVWLNLYREERGHLARTSKMCIDANISARIVAIAEDQGRILASAIRTVLSLLSLSPEQEALVPQIVPPILRAVASNQPIPDLRHLIHEQVLQAPGMVAGELA